MPEDTSRENPVRRLRRMLGMSQADFGRILGRSYQSVQNYERGIGDLPPSVLQRMNEVALEKGFFDIALALEENDWRRAPAPPDVSSAASFPVDRVERDTGDRAHWHQLLDAALDDPLAAPVIEGLLSYFERGKIGASGVKIDKAGKK